MIVILILQGTPSGSSLRVLICLSRPCNVTQAASNWCRTMGYQQVLVCSCSAALANVATQAVSFAVYPGCAAVTYMGINVSVDLALAETHSE
jgi:hypothetical protein